MRAASLHARPNRELFDPICLPVATMTVNELWASREVQGDRRDIGEPNCALRIEGHHRCAVLNQIDGGLAWRQ
jgi:hypothetical protein